MHLHTTGNERDSDRVSASVNSTESEGELILQSTDAFHHHHHERPHESRGEVT